MKNDYNILAVGLLGVAAAASLSFLFNNVWIGIYSALFVSIVYLFFLDKRLVNNLQSAGVKKTVRYLIGLLVITQLYAMSYDYTRSNRQYNTLMDIRTTIENSLAQLESEQTLIVALRHYHHEAEKDNRTIASSFKEVTKDRLLEDATLVPSIPNNSPDLNFMVEIPNSDTVLIKVTSDAARGKNPEFVNYGSDMGKYQAIATLTTKGVSYEREN